MCAVSTLDSNQNVTKSSYHHGNLRETLIEQGLLLLEKNQNTDFSMRELTRLIGVSPNAVYRHFSNKDELLTALAIYGFEKLLIEQGYLVLEKDNVKDGFIETGKHYVKFAMTNPTLFRLMYSRFTLELQNEHLKSLSNLAYQCMLIAVGSTLKLDIQSSVVQTVAIKCWSTVHGLSHLLIDGQFDHLTYEQKILMIEDILSTTYGLN